MNILALIPFIYSVAAFGINHNVVINGQINDRNVAQLVSILTTLDNKDTVTLEINSLGGDKHALDTVLPLMHQHSSQLTCNTTTGATSAAAFMWAACEHRAIASGASVTFHLGSHLDATNHRVFTNRSNAPELYRYAVTWMYVLDVKQHLSPAQWQAFLKGDDVFITKAY